MTTKPSKRLSGKSAEEWQESLWDIFIDALLKIKSRQELKKAIAGLFSAQERSFMLRRLATTALLKEGKSYQEIGEILWISPSTISAIKRHLINHGHSYKGSGALKTEKLKLVRTLNKDVSGSITNPIEQAVVDFVESWLALGSDSAKRNDYFARRVRKGK